MQANTAKAALAGCAIGAALYFAFPGCFDIETSGKQVADANHPEIPEGSAAKVAAVMAAEGITLPQVAAYLNTYGFDVIDRSRLTRWQWSPAPAGTYPVAYYVANFRVATGDTSLVVYCPVTAGPYWMRVKAYDGHGNSGPWSQSSVSGPGDLLPGVAE